MVLNTVIELKGLPVTLSLDRLNFKGATTGQRPAFSTQWIKEKLLAPDALAGLNPDARYLVLGMINTGYRPREGANLRETTIHLEGAVPYIEILPEGREVKTAQSIRKIPLTGVSLEAFRAMPEGAKRYRDKAPTLSATVNGYLKKNGLLETDAHTMYSLRHSFEDRMLAAYIDDRIRRDLFGHKLDRERYGQGHPLSRPTSCCWRWPCERGGRFWAMVVTGERPLGEFGQPCQNMPRGYGEAIATDCNSVGR